MIRMGGIGGMSKREGVNRHVADSLYYAAEANTW